MAGLFYDAVTEQKQTFGNIHGMAANMVDKVLPGEYTQGQIIGM
jgi:hypothetical protein